MTYKTTLRRVTAATSFLMRWTTTPLICWLARKALIADGWTDEGDGKWSLLKRDSVGTLKSIYREDAAVRIMLDSK